MKIAIVGSGISGLVCGYILHKHHEISVFESGSYIGGHTHTHTVADGQQTLSIDTGFIVFNKKTYPNFLRLLEQTEVEFQPTAMSFSVKNDVTGLEYNGTSLNGLFAQRQNILKMDFWKMLTGIIRFNKEAKTFLANEPNPITFAEFAKKAKLNDQVINLYIIPMAAAVWSADPIEMWNFPAEFMLRFWDNHGFLNINDRPQWYVIKGGSSAYIKKLTQGFDKRILLNSRVTRVRRQKDKVFVSSALRGEEQFDAVIFANHSDQALANLQDASSLERDILSAIPYQENAVFLHKDAAVLPRSKIAWAAWNYHLTAKTNRRAVVTYNMNILQSLPTEQVYNVTLNPTFEIQRSLILKEITYHHPIFTLAGLEAQKRHKELLGPQNTFYCGAYWRNGFHEDGVVSALRVCDALGVRW